MSKTHLFMALLTLSSASLVLAGAPVPPPNWAEGLSFEKSTNIDPVTPLQMGALQIILEKTSLEEARSNIGVGEVASQGDASESISWLCYTVSSTKPRQRIWLTSSELGGGTIINGFSAIKISSASKALSQCPELPKRFSNLYFTRGIWLGVPSQTVAEIFSSAKQFGNVWLQVYLGTRGEFDVGGTVAIQISNSRVVAIHASHTTTN